ncbi:MAG: nitrilase-related carbon-nitrogen hydrolase [Chloroflexota bacterium]
MFGEKAKAGYPVVPLRSEKITVVIIQSRIKQVSMDDIKGSFKQNLDHMAYLLSRARGKKDLVVFHEFPINGFAGASTRDDQLKTAIEIPGPETEFVGKLARENNCYIHFGCYGKLPDWPGHFTNMGIIVGPSGKIVHLKWKQRNMAGLGFSTTIFDVLDKYIEKYGWDAVFPVARLDIGNIAIMPEVFEPEIARVFATKGTEILIRYMTAGSGYWGTNPVTLRGGGINTFRIDFQATCMQNSIYGIFVNNAVSPDGGTITDAGAGGASIYDYDGRVMCESTSNQETMVWATIPLADFRKEHELPKWPKELFTNFYENYVSKFPPNSFTKSMPMSFAESLEHYRKIARW